MWQSIRASLFVMSAVTLLAIAAAAQRGPFHANLSGAEQVPPVTTAATGTATFQLSADGKRLTYTLTVDKADNVIMAHIHLGAKGANGPVVVWLYPAHPPEKLKPGSFSGTLAKGTITAVNLTGPLKGKTIADLVARIQSGDTYVNVHTQAHPEGEIRGQIE